MIAVFESSFKHQTWDPCSYPFDKTSKQSSILSLTFFLTTKNQSKEPLAAPLISSSLQPH